MAQRQIRNRPVNINDAALQAGLIRITLDSEGRMARPCKGDFLDGYLYSTVNCC